MRKTILTPLQQIFLNVFFESYLGEKFFLTGGTALAEFHLKHRLSEDLDLFTIDQNLDFNLVNAEMNKLAYQFQQFFINLSNKLFRKIKPQE